jgi:DnaJ-class molecular chaperone
MSKAWKRTDYVPCPECKGRGMIRPEGEWANETCPTCDGRGEVPSERLGADTAGPAEHPRSGG